MLTPSSTNGCCLIFVYTLQKITCTYKCEFVKYKKPHSTHTERSLVFFFVLMKIENFKHFSHINFAKAFKHQNVFENLRLKMTFDEKLRMREKKIKKAKTIFQRYSVLVTGSQDVSSLNYINVM